MLPRRSSVLLSLLILLVSCDPTRPEYQGGTAQCERPFEAVRYLDHDCRADRCEVEVEQEGCQVRIRPSGCELPPLEGVLDEGTVRFAPSPILGTCVSVTPTSDAVLAVDCDSPCHLELLEAGTAIPAEREEMVIDDHRFVPEDTIPFRLGRYSAWEGSLGPAIALEDQLLLVRYLDVRRVFNDDAFCPDAELLFIEGTTTVRVEPVPCITHLAQRGQELIATFEQDDRSHVGRFTLEGRLIQSATVSEELLVGLAVEPRLLITQSDTSVLALDEDLRPVAATPPLLRRTRARSTLRFADQLLVSETQDGQLLTFDATTLATGTVSLVDVRRASDDAGPMAVVDGRLLASATGERPAVWVLENPLGGPTLRTTTALFYETLATPWGTGPWPGRPDLAAVGLIDENLEAILGFLVVERAQFEPSSMRLGHGAVRQVLQVGGSIYVILPWSGRVIRLTPK